MSVGSQLKNEEAVDYGEMRFLEWNHKAIAEAKERFFQIALTSLREAVEMLADSVSFLHSHTSHDLLKRDIGQHSNVCHDGVHCPQRTWTRRDQSQNVC